MKCCWLLVGDRVATLCCNTPGEFGLHWGQRMFRCSNSCESDCEIALEHLWIGMSKRLERVSVFTSTDLKYGHVCRIDDGVHVIIRWNI